MNETIPIKRPTFEKECYEIRIRGHLQERWAEWFDDMCITHEKDGTTTLCGPLADQTALHGILLKIRNMNLRLISVREIEQKSNKNNI